MEKTFILFFIALAAISCNNGSSSKNESASELDSAFVSAPDIKNTLEAPSTREYKVISRAIQSMQDAEGNKVQKIHYSIEIPSEYDKDDLDNIANELKAKETVNRVFVEFYLEGKNSNNGNYALATRTPDDNSTKINYVAPPQEPKQKIKKPYDGCKVYGAWEMYGAKVIAYQKGGKCYMVNYYGGSNFDEPERYIKTSYRGRTAFKNADDPNEIYVINSNGDLDGYSYGDLASTFPMTIY